MALKNYFVLKARVVDKKLATKTKPHYQILLQDDAGQQHRIAVNVKSKQAPSELLYFFDDDFRHELTDRLVQADLPIGFTPVPSRPNDLALDFVRRNLFDVRAMKPLPFDVEGPDNDLNEKLDFYIKKAVDQPDVLIYAWGERWGPEENKPDQYFGFEPGSGIHDIHMNQGNAGEFKKDNGIWQDGGMLLHFAQTNRWVALFLAFQSQSFQTDEQGNAITDGGTWTDQQTRDLYIVAALVNARAGESEKVYLLNAGVAPVELKDWALADRMERKQRFGPQTVQAGELLVVPLNGGGPQLGNDGGAISLLDAEGKKRDGVSYTKNQVSRKGALVVFNR
ncbi:DUF2278 family protein [Larkinella soli]|uniref:DUF2278 family protein n=1 Tax=Larkinella soli TaxID=1770527 RepID=UPI000FFB2A28|nr:DUF2278 family protein [Larkinella soli]